MSNFTETYKRLLVEELTKEAKFDEFLNKRKAGADKIQKMTEKKGGYSTLTAIHYAAKEKPYQDCLKWEDKAGKEEHFKNKASEIYKKLKDLDSLSQREFQSLMGELEVYGEVYLRSTKPNSIKL